MSKLLENEVHRLEKQMLALCGLAEDAICKAVKAVEDRNRDLANAVIESDTAIDRAEVELEEEGLKTLALHQPVAVDLRFIVAVLKINSDLERLGDLATSIAKQALALADLPDMPQPFDVRGMSAKAVHMICMSIDALVRLDAAMARQVRSLDREVDTRHHENLVLLEYTMRERPASVPACMAYLAVSRSLERVGDHAKNIADDVIYMVEGEIVRHGGKTGAGASNDIPVQPETAASASEAALPADKDGEAP